MKAFVFIFCTNYSISKLFDIDTIHGNLVLLTKTALKFSQHLEQKVMETIIAGVRYDTVQRNLLSKPKTFILDETV